MGAEKQTMRCQECKRFDEAYNTMKGGPNGDCYIAMLQALEADLRENAAAYLPLAEQADVETLQKEGKVKWALLKTQQGPVLPIFTSIEQVKKCPSIGSVQMPIAAFFKVMEDNKEIVGFAVNPYDDQKGFLLDRKNLGVVLTRARGAQGALQGLSPEVVFKARQRLADCAVGVPAKVRNLEPEISLLGGLEGLVAPIREKWQRALKSGAFKPSSPNEFVRTIVKDAMTSAFVAGALVRRGVEMVRGADPEDCISRVEYLRDDLVQNTDEYLVCLSEELRASTPVPDANVLWGALANDIGSVVSGAVAFAFGWGLAKCCESEGEESLAALKARR